MIQEVLEALPGPRRDRRGLRGRRRDRHVDRGGRACRDGRRDHQRGSGRVPAGQRARHGALPGQGRERDGPLHTGGRAGEVRVDAGAVPRLRGAARRPFRQPAVRAGSGGEDRRKVGRRVRQSRRARRPRRRGEGQDRGLLAGSSRGGHAQPSPDRAGARRAAPGRARRPGGPALGPRPCGAGLRHPAVPGAARTALRHLADGGAGSRSGFRCRGSDARGRRGDRLVVGAHVRRGAFGRRCGGRLGSGHRSDHGSGDRDGRTVPAPGSIP